MDGVFKLKPSQKVFLSFLILYTWKCVRYSIFESDNVFRLFLKCNIFHMIRKIEITWNNIWRIGWPLQCTVIKIWVLIGDNLSYKLTLNDAKKIIIIAVLFTSTFLTATFASSFLLKSSWSKTQNLIFSYQIYY